MTKIAIVGAERKYWTMGLKRWEVEKRPLVVKEIIRILKSYEDPVLISGGCPYGGVDIWAEIIADALGIEKKIYKPDIHQWSNARMRCNDCVAKLVQDKSKSDGWYKCITCKRVVHKSSLTVKKGYMARNIEIATDCDILYCIDPSTHTSGGRWTMRKAEELEKEVHLVII